MVAERKVLSLEEMKMSKLGTVKVERDVVQLARTELELYAIDSAYSEMRYLQYRPKTDSWSSYCQAVNSKVSDAINRAEFWHDHPDHKFG